MLGDGEEHLEVLGLGGSDHVEDARGAEPATRSRMAARSVAA